SAENPAAIRFYQREGFSEIGRIPGGVLEEGREIDDVMMARRIVD
ncbi:N-acetyltransferase family protein, partial [Rhizobium phaseoli]